MGFIQRLFGAGRDHEGVAPLSVRLASDIADMIIMARALHPYIDKAMRHPEKRKPVLCYFLGFADFMGQAKGLPREEILAMASCIYAAAFDMTDDAAIRASDVAAGLSANENGRSWIKAGAEDLGLFMAEQSGTPVTHRLQELISAVE